MNNLLKLGLFSTIAGLVGGSIITIGNRLYDHIEAEGRRRRDEAWNEAWDKAYEYGQKVAYDKIEDAALFNCVVEIEPLYGKKKKVKVKFVEEK